MASRVESRRYEIVERQHFEGGAVQRHVVHGNADGTTIEAQVCIVFHFAAGKITRIFEYLDAEAVAAVFGRTGS